MVEITPPRPKLPHPMVGMYNDCTYTAFRSDELDAPESANAC